MKNPDQKPFIITNWCGVPRKFIRHEDGSLAKERFLEARESGMNLFAIPDYGYETTCEVLSYCEEIGLRITLCDDRIAEAVADKTRRKELLRQVVEDYRHYPALFNYHVTDEPGRSGFEALAEVSAILRELDPEHDPYINLFPNYASAEMLGCATYREYLEEFVRCVHPTVLSYDHYHFCKGEPIERTDLSDRREQQIYEAAYSKADRPGFFDNIEEARQTALDADIPLMIIVLVVEHGPYRNLTEAELRFEVYQSLAYGIRWLSYFTYWTPGVDTDEGDDMWHWKNGMIAKDGQRTPHYEMVTRINSSVQAIGDILLSHKSLAVFHFGKEPDGEVTYWHGAYGPIADMTADRLTAGFFEDQYVLLANKDFESATEVTFTPHSHAPHVEKFDPETKEFHRLTGDNGRFTVHLEAGEGCLIRFL